MHIAAHQFVRARHALVAVAALSLLATPTLQARETSAISSNLSVGAQYDTTHVYLADDDAQDAFIKSFTATFGGKGSPPVVANILPEPSKTRFRYVWSPVGTLSTFAFQTPVPYPFGQERNGYLVTDMTQAVKAAKACGADVIVATYRDPIGRDTVIQWPGGVDMQLYWHDKKPSYAPLATVPVNRVYVSTGAANTFVHAFLCFSHGKVVSDDRQANAAEIGKPGQTYRRVRIDSGFGKVQVNVTDGQLPYPFGHEVTGYEVRDLTATLSKAKASGAKVLWGPYAGGGEDSVVVEFPGDYIAEIHAPTTH